MKAQIWSLDFIISVTIFTTMIIVFFFVFNILSTDASSQSELTRMQNSALEVTEAFIRTGGLPQDWNDGNVQVIGIAERDNVLNSTLLLRFISASLNYNTSKVLLGIGNYEYFFRIEHPNGTEFYFQGTNLTKGENYTSAKDIVTVERYVLLEGVKRLRFILWR